MKAMFEQGRVERVADQRRAQLCAATDALGPFSERHSELVRSKATGIEGAVAMQVEERALGWATHETLAEGAVVRFLSCNVQPDVAADMCEALLDATGVVPVGVEPDGQGRVPVPLLEPAEFRRAAVVWRVTDRLAVLLLDRGQVGFEFPGGGPILLGGGESWRLARALVSTGVGHRALELAAHAAIAGMAAASAAERNER